MKDGDVSTLAPGAPSRGVPRQQASLPRHGVCPLCCRKSSWEDILGSLKTAGWRKQNNTDNKEVECECEEDLQATSTMTPDDKVCHAPPQEVTTPLESLILKTQSLSMDHIHRESLAYRMLRRLREEGNPKTDKPCLNSVHLEDNANFLPKHEPNKENRVEYSDIDHSIINLCSSEEVTSAIIDLVDESPRSVESKVNNN
jgi:hypothetical protein